MPGAETVKLQVELIEKNAEARLRNLDKLAKEMANRKITLNFDESSLARWKTATEGMTNAQLSAYAKLAVGAENAAAKVVAADVKANQKRVSDEQKTNAKILADRQKSFDKKVELYEKEDTKRRQIAEKTAQTEINANAKVQVATIKGVQGTRKHTQAQKELNTEAKKTDSIFSSITSRFTAANLISSLITATVSKLRQALRQAVDEMKEMDKELTTIKMVSGATSEQIGSLRESAFAGAREMGRSVTDYLSAAERFTRAGYRDNIDQLSKLSLMTQNIGGVEEDTAAKFLLAADAAWKLNGSYDALMGVLDGVSAVADQNATDLGKIAEGITVAGSAFANAGESLQTFTAMLGVTTASTQRSGSEMARGLRTILFRVRQVKAEFEDGEIVDAKSISNAAKALEDVGISVRDETGDMKSMSRILTELSAKWGTLSKAEQSYLQNYLAGNRNGNVLFALMDNWDAYEKMLSQYEESSGTALQKNAEYTDSWAAATENLKTAWNNFVSSIVDSDSFKKATKYITDIVNAAADYVDYRNDQWLAIFGSTEEKEAAALKKAEEETGEAAEGASGKIIDYSDAVEGAGDSADEASGKIEKATNAFEKQRNVISEVAKAIKEEYDTDVNSLSDIYKAAMDAAEKGYYGSKAFTKGGGLFFSQEVLDDIRNGRNNPLKEAMDAYMEGISGGDYSNPAAEFFESITKGSNEIKAANGEILASVEDVGDAYKWTFDKGNRSMEEYLQSLENNTGVGKAFWASMIQSLGMYSDELSEWTENNGETKTEAEFETDAAKTSLKEYVELLDSVPREIQTVVTTIYQTTGSVTEPDIRRGLLKGAGSETNPSYTLGYAKGAPISALLPPKKAGGKRDNYSGLAIVNDEFPADGSKPELIISNSTGRAYIANGGRPALVNLRSDDMVLTASQTRSALGVPRFDTGKGLVGGLFGGAIGSFAQTVKEAVKKAVSTAVTIATPKTPTKEKTGSGKSSKVDPSDSWGSLKKLVDYLLEKADDDLKEKLKVLDEQLKELEAQRKAEEESKKLEEKQLAVQKALEDLQKAQTERTVRYYNEETQQWEWMADQGSVQKAQEAYDEALKDLEEYLEDKEYEAKKEEIQAQKDELQSQFDAFKESWEAIVEAIEAPQGDLAALLQELRAHGTSTMQGQVSSLADLLNALRDSLFSGGYLDGIGKIGANTPKSKTTGKTKFDSGGFAYGIGVMSKGTSDAETVLGPSITKDALNPIRNAQFSSFSDSIKSLIGSSSEMYKSGGGSSITNNSGGNIIVNGMKIGHDQYQQPFAKVMKNISIHANEHR